MCEKLPEDSILLAHVVLLAYKSLILVQENQDHSQQLLILALDSLEKLGKCVNATTHAVQFLSRTFGTLPPHTHLATFQAKIQAIARDL